MHNNTKRLENRNKDVEEDVVKHLEDQQTTLYRRKQEHVRL